MRLEKKGTANLLRWMMPASIMEFGVPASFTRVYTQEDIKGVASRSGAFRILQEVDVI